MPETMYLVSNNQLSSIGNSIRSKLGESNTYTVDEMPSKISSIGGGSSEQFKITTVSITYTGNDELRVYIPITFTNPDGTVRIIQPTMMFDTEEPTGTFNIVVPINGFTSLSTSYSYLKQSQVTITGDAGYQGGVINISGDCEITISDAK